jgi:hypothetical protein
VKRRKGTPAPDTSRERDLDETRRLAYMVLASRSTKRYVLAGTLVNALVHHQKAADPGQALQHLSALLEGSTDEAPTAWLHAHIDRVTAELEGS